jgi:hypothetical protein
MKARAGRALRLALVVALIAAALQWDPVSLVPSAEALPYGTLTAATLAYIIAMALPFCPGIEIGLAMLVVLGAKGAPLVYAATVFALCAAFAVGRLVPPGAVIALLGRLRLHRARLLLERMQALERRERLAFLLRQSPPRVARWLLEHRYLAVALALNTPGNLLIGDGGGIALAAGFSGLYSFPRFALTVVLAVAPVPLAVMLGALA